MSFQKHIGEAKLDLTYTSKQEAIEAYRKAIASLEYDFHSAFPGVSLYSREDVIKALIEKDELFNVNDIFDFYEFQHSHIFFFSYHRQINTMRKQFETTFKLFLFLRKFHFTIPSIAWEAFMNYENQSNLKSYSNEKNT